MRKGSINASYYDLHGRRGTQGGTRACKRTEEWEGDCKKKKKKNLRHHLRNCRLSLLKGPRKEEFRSRWEKFETSSLGDVPLF